MEVQQYNCNSINCNQVLNSMDEVKATLCESCQKNIIKENFYVGVCWKCNSITLVEKRPEYLKDKYIFSKGCVKCTNKRENNVSWITLKGKEKEKSDLVITVSGDLVNIKTSEVLNERHGFSEEQQYAIGPSADIIGHQCNEGRRLQ